VEQGHYGHRARKATWLYASGVPHLPLLRWGSSALEHSLTNEEMRIVMRTPKGLTGETRDARRELMARFAQETGKVLAVPEQMHKRERTITPAGFRDLLLSIVRTPRVRQRLRA